MGTLSENLKFRESFSQSMGPRCCERDPRICSVKKPGFALRLGHLRISRVLLWHWKKNRAPRSLGRKNAEKSSRLDSRHYVFGSQPQEEGKAQNYSWTV